MVVLLASGISESDCKTLNGVMDFLLVDDRSWHGWLLGVLQVLVFDVL